MESINVLFTSQIPTALFSFENYFRKSKRIHLTTKLITALNIIDKQPEKNGSRIKIKEEKCDLLIFDVDAANESESELIRNILTSDNKEIKKILYTSLQDKKQIDYFLSRGVDGIVSKRDGFEAIEECMLHVYKNNKYYSRFIQNVRSEDEKLSHNLPELGFRERQVISLRLEGNTNRQIAQILKLGIRTVESYLYSAKVKLNMGHISDLLIWAAKNLMPVVIPLLLNSLCLMDWLWSCGMLE